MLNKNKLQELKNKRSDLIRYLHHCGYHKKRVIEIVREISSQHKSNRITYEEYSRKLSFSLNQRTPEQWLDYYDERIRECNKQLERVAGEIENEESRARKAKSAYNSQSECGVSKTKKFCTAYVRINSKKRNPGFINSSGSRRNRRSADTANAAMSAT